MNADVRRVLQGDTDAYRSIVKEFGAGIRAFLAAHLGDPDTVDDLAQETFVAAYENLGQFDPDADMGPWLKGIARNKLLMYLRRLYLHGRALDKLKAEALQGALQAAGAADEGPALDRLRRCLEKLPDRLKTVIQARYFERKKVYAIAESRRTSPTAVSSLLFRGRKELEACMGAR